MSFSQLLNQLMDSPGAKGALGGAASGAAVSLLMNKKARKKLGGAAVKVGGAAAVAGLGYFAYKKWQAGRASAPAHPPSGAAAGHSPVDPVPAELPGPAITENLAAAMVRAMIAAALADGELDASQMEAVEAALDNPALTEEEKRELTLCLHRPPTVDAIAALVDNEEEASEVYGACLAVVNPGNLAESLFLRRLGKALRLSPELVEALHGSAQSQFEQA